MSLCVPGLSPWIDRLVAYHPGNGLAKQECVIVGAVREPPLQRQAGSIRNISQILHIQKNLYSRSPIRVEDKLRGNDR